MYSLEDVFRLTSKLWAPLLCLKQKGNYITLQDEQCEPYVYWGNVFYKLPKQQGVVISTTYFAKVYLRRKLRYSGPLIDSPVLQYPI